MTLVLDASVALAWCFEDEGGDYPVRVLEALQEAASGAWQMEPLPAPRTPSLWEQEA